jgi:hypothetical protein
MSRAGSASSAIWAAGDVGLARREVRRLVRPIGLVLGAASLSSPLAWAERPQTREGFWIGFGFGYGSASTSADCAGCSGDRESSVSGFLKLGGTLNQHVLLGVESNAWMKDEGDNTTMTLGALTGTVTFYPQAKGGFFLKAGAGASYVSSDFQEGSITVSASKTGWAVLGGAGYDLRVARNISLTPCFNYHYGKPGDLDVSGFSIPGFKQNVFSFELGVTFH